MDRFWRRAGARLVQVLFGGTFDPVHDGHVMMVESLMRAFPNATVHVIPNHQPPHRASMASSEHRLAMLKAAMDGMSQAVVNAIELDRSGPSYTVDTLRAFREQFGTEESLVFCLGADAARAVDQWYRPELLAELSHLCILNRADQRIEIPQSLSAYRWTDELCEMREIGFGLLAFLDTPNVPVSSTGVRELIAKDESRLPVPPKIADYIRQHRLYQDA